MARKSKNPVSLGLSAKQRTAADLLAKGRDEDQVVYTLYGARSEYPEERPAYTKGLRELRRWMRLPAFQELYRARVLSVAMPMYGKALQTIKSQMDSDNAWIAQGAAREVLSRFGDAVMGTESNETVIKIEGMPTIGEPTQDTLADADIGEYELLGDEATVE